MTEIKENGTKEEGGNQEDIKNNKDLESKYKILAETEDKMVEVVSQKQKELEDLEAKIVKAKFAKKKAEESLGGDDEPETKPVIDPAKVADIVSQELAKKEQQTDGQHLQKLISEVEDPYQAKAILKEIENTNSKLPAAERFNLAKTLVDVKLQSKIKDAPKPDNAGGEAPSQGRQDQDALDEYTKQVYERAGIGDMYKKR